MARIKDTLTEKTTLQPPHRSSCLADGVDADIPLPRKSQNPEILAQLFELEQAIFARAQEKGILAQPPMPPMRSALMQPAKDVRLSSARYKRVQQE